jgi:ABC-type dipeptide/oligopeptide/nickel transport system ATPase component
VLRAGECAVVVGPTGSGKTTLLLCAAGLLTPEIGEREWFGDASRAAAARRALYHRAPADLVRAGGFGEPHVHLLDALASCDSAADAWIEQRCDLGDAVLVAARDDAIARRLAARAFTLRAGRLDPATPVRARVAERARR